MNPIVTIALLGCTSLALASAALADDDAKINARIAASGTACQNAVAVKFPRSTMAAITVELGATMQQGIDAGSITLQDIQKGGLSFNWSFRKHSGFCNTDGAGNVVELKTF